MVKEESHLEIKYISSDNAVDIIRIVGSLDAFTAESLETAIGDLHAQGKNRIAVDFTGLNYISSAGLGVFMSYIEEIRAEGGDIKMFGMNDKIFKIFDLLGFPMIFDITETQQQAIDKFEEGA